MDKYAQPAPRDPALGPRCRRLISCSDDLVNARTALGDHATGKMLEEVLRRTLAVPVEEGEKATEEAQHYMEEIGIRPE